MATSYPSPSSSWPNDNPRPGTIEEEAQVLVPVGWPRTVVVPVDDGDGTRIYPDYGSCDKVFGYMRHGPKCKALKGCGCEGTPTGCPPNYFEDRELCEEAALNNMMGPKQRPRKKG